MDALTTVVTKRKEKRYCITSNHSLCHYSWHLYFCFFALISPPSNKEKRKETCCLYSQKSELLFPDLWWETSALVLNKIRTEGEVWVLSYILPHLVPAVFPPSSPISVLQLGTPLASHPEFLAQCRKFSQLPEVWCIPGLFLIWALISSKNEAIYQCFSNISGEIF